MNLLVGADRVGADFELEDAAAATLEHCRANFAEFRVEQEKVAEIAGRPAALRFQSFAVEGVEDRLLQLQVLLFAPPDGRRETKDLFHIDGTCLDARQGDLRAGVPRRRGELPLRVIAFTAEELHFLAGGAPIPGLGPLPLDPADEAALRLMRGTAERSLTARGLLGAREVTALLEPLIDPDWFATAVRGTARAWARRQGRATELAQVGPTDYTLTAVTDIRARIADFLDLHGDDDARGLPETPDEHGCRRCWRRRRR